MTISKKLTQIVPLLIITLGLLTYNFMSAQWSGPTAEAPGNNTKAPINIGTSTASIQTGLGSLVFNRFAAVTAVWSNQYCDATGGNCFAPTSVGGGGTTTMANFYTYSTNQNPQAYPNGTACTCQSGELLTGCSGFQRGENDTQQLPGGINGCYSDGSTVAQCHCMGSGSRTKTYAWSAPAWGFCSDPNDRCGNPVTQRRTISCVRSDNVTVNDSFCTGPKPNDSQSCYQSTQSSCRN